MINLNIQILNIINVNYDILVFDGNNVFFLHGKVIFSKCKMKSISIWTFSLTLIINCTPSIGLSIGRHENGPEVVDDVAIIDDVTNIAAHS